MGTDSSGAGAVQHELAAAIQAAVASHVDEGWAMLADLVAVDSPPDHPEGLERVVEIAAERFTALGLATSVERTDDGHPVLHATSAGDGRRVLLVGHLDTVFPVGTTAEWGFARAEDRAIGPGIADAKGGAAVLWLALAAALEVGDRASMPGVHVILNTDEEAGSVQSRPIFEREAQAGADFALVYEPGRPDGTIVRQRRGARRYRVTVRGKAAHTGVEPWVGVNAIEAASHKVLALQELNDRDRFLSVTVSLMRGGTRINVVPDEAVIEVDSRLPDDETAEATHRAVEAIIAHEHVPGSLASYEVVSHRPPMMPQPGVEVLLDRFAEAGRLIGVRAETSATGGGSDGCFISIHGVPTVDALGPIGGGYHTGDEFVVSDTLRQRSALSAVVLAGISN